MANPSSRLTVLCRGASGWGDSMDIEWITSELPPSLEDAGYAGQPMPSAPSAIAAQSLDLVFWATAG